MLDSRKREIRIKADYFRTNCKIGRYGIINLFSLICSKNVKEWVIN